MQLSKCSSLVKTCKLGNQGPSRCLKKSGSLLTTSSSIFSWHLTKRAGQSFFGQYSNKYSSKWGYNSIICFFQILINYQKPIKINLITNALLDWCFQLRNGGNWFLFIELFEHSLNRVFLFSFSCFYCVCFSFDFFFSEKKVIEWKKEWGSGIDE